MADISIMELLEKMKKDDSWCPEEAKRIALANKLVFFIIEN